MANRINISTNNNEIFQKLQALNYNSEVLIPADRYGAQMGKIVNNINRNSKQVNVERIGNYVVLKKNNQLNYNVYLKNKIKRIL